MGRLIMVSPVNQVCPECHTPFIGSDAIGDPCPSCKTGELLISPGLLTAKEILKLYNDIMEETNIIAYDHKGNKFAKAVHIREGLTNKSNKYGHYGKVIDFGWPCDYYINSLLKMYPFERDFYIDSEGQNHKGSPVYIKKEDLNDLFEKLNLVKINLVKEPGEIDGTIEEETNRRGDREENTNRTNDLNKIP